MQIDIERFKGARILIAGDVMLDRYWWGDVNRISPEAPVPVVRLRGRSFAPGGAANVATNVAGLGATPVLIGVIGNDPEGAELANSLEEKGIAASGLVRLEGRSTIVKTRIVAHGQQMVRVDKEDLFEPGPDELELLLERLDAEMDAVDLVLISDYGKGLLSSPVLRAVIETARAAEKPVLIDPKGRDYSRYAGANLVTPNKREAAETTGISEELDEMVMAAGPAIAEANSIENVLITQGEHGMTLFQKGEPPFHIPAATVETYDVTGAGDTVIATIAVAHASGLGLREAAQIANAAAGAVVQHVGTTSITTEMLRSVTAANQSDS